MHGKANLQEKQNIMAGNAMLERDSGQDYGG